MLTGKNASLHIDINPRNPTTLPDCRFFGADQGWYSFVTAHQLS